MTATNILLVEADPIVRQKLAEYLRECGYRVLEATTTDEASLVLSRGPHAVDVALVDVNSPGQMDGFGLAHWIRANTPAVKVALAGTLTKAARAAHDLCEEGPLLAKPYDHQILLDRIKSLVAERDRERGTSS